MKLVQWSPDQLGTLNTFGPSTFPSFDAGVEDAEDNAGFVETAALAFQRENTIAAAIKELGAQMDSDHLTASPDAINPYRYAQENWDEETLRTLEPELRKGLFDDVRSPADMQFRTQHVLAEKKALTRIENGSGFGAFVGSIGAALLDPVSYVPLAGWVTKARSASRLVNVARGALLGSTAAIPAEVALHQFQDLRTLEESFLAIGTGGLLGGGLGYFSRLAVPGHALHPDNPKNPYRLENVDSQPVGVRTAEGDVEELRWDDSLSAARVHQEVPERVAGITDAVPGLRRVTDAVNSVSPVGRALQWTGGRTRALVTSMLDLGGTLTRNMRQGVAQLHSVEDLKRNWRSLSEQFQLKYESGYREVNRLVGDTKVKQLTGRDILPSQDYQAMVRRKLKGTWSDADAQALVKKIGPDIAAKVDAVVERVVEERHLLNDKYMKGLQAIGKLQDPVKLDQLTKTRAAARQAVKDFVAQEQAALDDAVKKAGESAGPGDKGKAAKAARDAFKRDTDKLEELREKVRAAEASHDEEFSKIKPLGRDYGHAQMWDSSSIAEQWEDFEHFLYEVLKADPTEDWLLNLSTVADGKLTKADFNRLGKEPLGEISVEEGAELRRQIMREWAGDEHDYTLAQAERALDVAREAEKQATLDLQERFLDLGIIRGVLDKFSITEARKARDLHAKRTDELRAHAELKRRDAQALTKAAIAARQMTLDRALEAAPAGPDVLSRLSDEMGPPNLTGDLKVETPARTPDRAAAEAEAKRAGVEANRAERRWKDAQERLTHADDALRVAQEAKESVKRLREQAKVARADAAAAAKEARKDVNAAQAGVRKAAKRTPLDQAVELVRTRLSQKSDLPYSILENVAVDPGRVKERVLRLTPEQERLAEERGFLRTDLPSILHAQDDQLSGTLALHEALDIGKGRTFDSWGGESPAGNSVLGVVRKEYDDLIAAAKTPAEKKRLDAERDKALKDINLLKDRILGTEDVGASRDSWEYWLSAKVRQANFIRYVAGFLPASISELASLHLTSGPLSILFKDHAGPVASLMRNMYRDDPTEFQAMLLSTELSANGMRASRVADADDAMLTLGIGKGRVRRATSAIDRAGLWMSEKGNILSGMRTWTRFGTMMSGMHRAQMLRKHLGNYDKLDARMKTNLASLGIDADGAARIHKMMEQFQTVDDKGRWDPGLEKWSATPAGARAHRDFRIAVQRDMARGVFKPGIGDLPAITGKWYGKLWLQFQSYAFTFINRFIAPASQRIASERDVQAMVSFAHLAWTGMITVMAKDVILGKNPLERFEEKNLGQTAMAVVDRSGLMGYLSPYVDSLLKFPLGDETVGSTIGLKPTDRYSRNNWAQSLAGPAAALLGDVANAAGAVGTGDPDKIASKVLLLAPMNAYGRLMMNFSDLDPFNNK